MSASLQDLVNSIDWLQITPVRGGYHLSSKLAIRYAPKPNGGTVKVKFSNALLEELEWQIGDIIYPSQSRDNLKAYRLTKNAGGTGYKLSREGAASKSAIISFPWMHPTIPIEKSYTPNLEYQIHNGSLFFKG